MQLALYCMNTMLPSSRPPTKYSIEGPVSRTCKFRLHARTQCNRTKVATASPDILDERDLVGLDAQLLRQPPVVELDALGAPELVAAARDKLTVSASASKRAHSFGLLNT